MVNLQVTTYSVGILGFAWWILSKHFRREILPRQIPKTKALTVREPDEVSVVTYNVLADNVVQNNPVYKYARELHRSWEYRWNKLIEEFKIFDADIICLQEVETSRWQEWLNAMGKLGYTGILQNRKIKKRQKHLSISNAIFFKTKKFDIYWQEHRHRVLALGLGWTDSSGKDQMTFVVNCHLEGHPYKPTERISQIYSILRKMEKHQGENAENCDIVICGDFNSNRFSGPWKLLYKGRLEAGYTESYYPDVTAVKKTIAHPYALQDVYATAKATPEFTTRAPRRRVEVDFIFCSRHLKVGAVLKAADVRGMSNIDSSLIPNANNPSDHLPLGAVILHSKTMNRNNDNRRNIDNEDYSNESNRAASIIERSSVSSLSDSHPINKCLINCDTNGIL